MGQKKRVQMRFKELESEKLVLEEEMRKLKESDEDSLVEQMMVNKALEVEKQVAENKAEEWKIKFEKLAEAVRKLDELGAFRVGELELDEDVKVGLELAGVGKKKIESLCREGLVNHQVSGEDDECRNINVYSLRIFFVFMGFFLCHVGCSPCVTTPVKDSSMSGRNRDDVSSRRRVNMMLVFEGDGCKSTHVVDLSDSETEEGNDREEECEDEDVGACEVDTNICRKRKRVITSDSENDDDDDNIPIATLKNLKPPPQSTGENVSGGMRKQRRVSSRLRKQKEISTSSECNPTERLVGIPTTGNAHDDDDTEEESEQESESDSLNGFIVDDETASEEGAEGAVPEEEGSDGETGYADVIARLRRDKKPGEHKWNLEGEMLAAFGKDPELCMRAVCVLYRFQTEGEKATRSSHVANGRGFSMADADR